MDNVISKDNLKVGDRIRVKRYSFSPETVLAHVYNLLPSRPTQIQVMHDKGQGIPEIFELTSIPLNFIVEKL